MTWTAITLDELNSLISRDLAKCSAEAQALFERVRFVPVKWKQSPWGDEGGGFWA